MTTTRDNDNDPQEVVNCWVSSPEVPHTKVAGLTAQFVCGQCHASRYGFVFPSHCRHQTTLYLWTNYISDIRLLSLSPTIIPHQPSTTLPIVIFARGMLDTLLGVPRRVEKYSLTCGACPLLGG